MNQATSIKIETLGIKDIPNLIDCVRRCYGDSYPFKSIYSQSALEDLINNKTMYSVIAKDLNGKVLGHGSLTFSSSNNSSPELGKLFVDPEYRGHHIANLLANKLLELSRDLSLPGFWAECVTNHPYSQDVLISSGGIEVGLLLGDIPATIKMQGENNFADSRMSLLAYYVPSPNAQALDIFVPESHLSLIQSMAKNANQERSISTETSSGSGDTKLLSTIDQVTLVANIQIIHVGTDFHRTLQLEVGNLEMQNLSSIYIDLPICDPAATKAYLELEKMGFFFSAWLPHFTNDHDVLRVQKIYTELNVTEIICASEPGKKMKEYVLSEWQRVSKETQQ